MKSPFKTKKKTTERNPSISYQKRGAYHYSARRSQADKKFDRSDDSVADSRKNFRVADKVNWLLFFGGVIILTICSLYMLSLSSSPQIIINGKHALLRDQKTYDAQAQTILNGSLLSRTKLTINTDKVANEIATKFPEFSKVAVSTPIIRHKPVIEVTLAQPAALLVSGQTTYLLDEQGRALFDIKSSNSAYDASDLPHVTDQTHTSVKLGKPALTSTQVNFIHDIAIQSQNKGLKVSSMDLVAGGGELDVRYDKLSYYVKYNLFEDARKSSGTFFAVKERLELENKPPAEYIDVRVAERAYVK